MQIIKSPCHNLCGSSRAHEKIYAYTKSLHNNLRGLLCAYATFCAVSMCLCNNLCAKCMPVLQLACHLCKGCNSKRVLQVVATFFCPRSVTIVHITTILRYNVTLGRYFVSDLESKIEFTERHLKFGLKVLKLLLFIEFLGRSYMAVKNNHEGI